MGDRERDARTLTGRAALCAALGGVLLLAAAPPVRAQAADVRPPKLATLFRDVFGPRGLVVNSEAVLPDGSTHSAHFNSAFQSEFTQFNVALASQLTSLPLPSPASGFTYSFDAASGTFVRSTQSFGPILSDRAETIGRGRLSFGYNFQYFSFDTLQGVDLSRVPAVFVHDAAELGGGRTDVVTTINAVEATVGQITGALTYGITDRVDLSLAVPIVRTSLRVVSNAQVQRVGTGPAVDVHFFEDATAPGGYGDQRQFAASGTASGLGDLVIRLKGIAMREGRRGLALGVDFRVPSGDEQDLLGSGALGLKPFAALSVPLGPVAPHINVGYQWNGRSVLGGNSASGEKGPMPDQLLYSVGVDYGLTPQLTVAADLLGRHVLDSPQLVRRTFEARGSFGTASFPDIRFTQGSFSVMDAALGLKANVTRNVLVNFNLRFKLNDNGLGDRVTPLIGVEIGS